MVFLGMRRASGWPWALRGQGRGGGQEVRKASQLKSVGSSLVQTARRTVRPLFPSTARHSTVPGGSANRPTSTARRRSFVSR